MWEPAVQVVNPYYLDASISSISCTAPGDCAATGTYTGILNYQDVTEGFVVEERSGIWGAMTPVPGLAALNVAGDAFNLVISCASPGNCTVAGEYQLKYVSEIFVANEHNGAWGRATPLPGLIQLDDRGDADLTGLSCGAPGDCAAVGYYLYGIKGPYNDRPFLAFSQGGQWFLGPPPGYAQLDEGYGAALDFASCTGPGSCVAAGNYVDSKDEQDQGVIIGEADGFWGTTTRLPGAPANSEVTALSCAAPGSCVAAGTYRSAAMKALEVALWQQKGGTWSGPRLVPALAGIAELSCPSPTACTAVGYLNGAGAHIPTTGWGATALLVERNGVWGAPQAIPGLGALGRYATSDGGVYDLSCGSAGDCALTGYYAGENSPWGQFVASETSGNWGKPRPAPGVTSSANQNGALSQLSCSKSGYCGAAGADSVTYASYPGLVFSGAVVASLAARGPTETSLTLFAGKVSYGREQTAKLAVRVTAHGAGNLAGTVTIRTGKTSVCVLTLKSGRGTCALSQARLRPGSYHLLARYSGSALYARSASAARTLTVVQ